MTTLTPLMTAADVLAMPDNPRVIRELYRGILRERKVTKRNYPHSKTMSMVVHRSLQWLGTQPSPHGDVVSGEAAVRIKADPDTFVGVDIALISAELAKATPRNAAYIDGIPTLIVEILSPSDRQRMVTRKVDGYVDAGVPLIWVMNPDLEMVTVIEPGKPPVAFNITQSIPDHPAMPGFMPSVKDLFA